jgi:hypothetical protein
VRRLPSRLSLAVTAVLVTGLVVSLGVVFSPHSGAGPERLEASDLARAALLSAPREPEGYAEDPAVATLPPWREAPPVTFELKPEPKHKPNKKKHKQKDVPLPEADFVISSFNVLGSSHTAGRGGMASGAQRMRQVVNLLAHHGVDVVGFQELQTDQYRELLRVAGGTYDVYPGTAAGTLGVDNSIAWRTSEWTAVQLATIPIPYFDGNRRPMPYVLLKHNVSGRYAWFANFHNPATNPKRGNNDRWRALATTIQIQLAQRLIAETGYPVFFTGDMNEREQYFCRLTGSAPMIAANGGSNEGGACRPPAYPMPVDWIFGSNQVEFLSYYRDESLYVRRTSDHPMIVAQAVLDEDDGAPADAGAAD